MKLTENSLILILCGTMLAFISSGCQSAPQVSPLQSAAGKVVLRDPRNPGRWVEYGRACYISNNFHGAELAFRRAIQLNEKYIPAYKHLGLVLVTLQRQPKAEEIYKQALKISDGDSELWTAYGYCLVDLGKDKQALEAFQRSISLNTNPISIVSAELGISALLRRQGDEAGARQAYERAVNINPEIIRMLDEHKALSGTMTVEQSRGTIP